MKTILRFFLGRYSFFVFTGLAFLIWILFLDANSIWSMRGMWRERAQYVDGKEYYTRELERVTRERKEVMGNDEALEKFAREKYLMKKEGETVFVVVDKDGKYLE